VCLVFLSYHYPLTATERARARSGTIVVLRAHIRNPGETDPRTQNEHPVTKVPADGVGL